MARRRRRRRDARYYWYYRWDAGGAKHERYVGPVTDKSITDRVTLSGMTLMNWQVYLLPLSDAWMAGLKTSAAVAWREKTLEAPAVDEGRAGMFFRGAFRLDQPARVHVIAAGERP